MAFSTKAVRTQCFQTRASSRQRSFICVNTAPAVYEAFLPKPQLQTIIMFSFFGGFFTRDANEFRYSIIRETTACPNLIPKKTRDLKFMILTRSPRDIVPLFHHKRVVKKDKQKNERGGGYHRRSPNAAISGPPDSLIPISQSDT